MVSRQIPASVAQRLLWMIRHYRPEFGALNCPLLCRIRGPLDTSALGAALDALAQRHESLRTTFAGRGARLMQTVHDPAHLPLRRVDLTPQNDPAGVRPDAESVLRTAIRVELAEPIDPQEWPARATLWRLAPDDHVLCLNLHHLVTDAWSTGILLRDVSLLYALATGTDGAAELPPAGWQYADFTDWQQHMLGGDELRRHQSYWRRQLTGTQLPRLGLALDPAARPTAPDAAPPDTEMPAGAASLDLDAATVATLRDLARTRHTTLFAVLLAGFYAQLNRVTGQPDLAVGSMFANRSRPELRETVGLLANMVLLRAQIPPDASLGDLIVRAHSSVIGAFTYQDLPYQMLPMDVVQTAGARTDDVMFQVMAAVEHRIAVGPVSFELLLPEDIGSRFPFELTLAPIGTDRIRAVLFHAAPWCDVATAETFLTGYADLLSIVARQPDTALATLSII